MIRTALAFVLGLSIGMLYVREPSVVGLSLSAAAKSACAVEVHLRAMPAGVFGC